MALNLRHGHVGYVSSQVRAGIRAPAVGKIDDLHFLDCSQREGRASNDHIKYLANHSACTIVGTGVDLETSPLLSEGRGTGRNTQTAGRFSHHHLRPFALATKEQAEQWIGVVATLEDALALYHHEHGSLARRHWRYLHE